MSELAEEFTAQVYRAAAAEHLTRLESFYFEQHYVWALYAAGVAVEAIFRAYRRRIDATFDSRHNLHHLAKAAKFITVVPARRVQEYTAALGLMGPRWSNKHRYRSEAALRAFLKRGGFDRQIRGDFLKENARVVVNAATFIVNVGLLRWTTFPTA